MVHTYMGFIGVRLSAKNKGFCFIGLGTYLIEYSTIQYSTILIIHSKIVVPSNHTVIQYEVKVENITL